MAKKKNKTPPAEVVLPESFQDMVRAIADLEKVANILRKWLSASADLYDSSKARKAAKNLSALKFTPQGSRNFLERIAAGGGD